ncbi:Crp/Fnr family transcriptional regulator [Cereibacter changlensis]
MDDDAKPAEDRGRGPVVWPEQCRSLMRLASDASRAALKAMAAEREIPAGTVLAEEGQSPTEVGYVLEGTLGMVKLLPDGRRHIIGILIPTDLFGRVFEVPPSFRVVALTRARLLTFPLAPFQELLERDPALERLFMVQVLDELDAAREWLLLMSGLRVIQRVASFLILLGRRSGGGGREGDHAAARPEEPGAVSRGAARVAQPGLRGTGPQAGHRGAGRAGRTLPDPRPAAPAGDFRPGAGARPAAAQQILTQGLGRRWRIRWRGIGAGRSAAWGRAGSGRRRRHRTRIANPS